MAKKQGDSQDYSKGYAIEIFADEPADWAFAHFSIVFPILHGQFTEADFPDDIWSVGRYAGIGELRWRNYSQVQSHYNSQHQWLGGGRSRQ